MGNYQSTSITCKIDFQNIKAVIFDIGGVVTSSPIIALLEYEASINLPKGTLWKFLQYENNNGDCARFERNEITCQEFCKMMDAKWIEFARDGKFTNI
jgi:putative hydrolase of the HAD superfamily